MSYHQYHDRKKLKWQGFYLSEHTRDLTNQEHERAFIWPQKPAMTQEEINQVLSQAKMKNSAVTIQIEEMNEENLYPADIIGKIQGYDELGFYIANQRIEYDKIRNVEFHHSKKWSDLD